MADEPIATAIAGGTYVGDEDTFISNRLIRTPEIQSGKIIGGEVIGAKFIASNTTPDATSGGMLEFYDGRNITLSNPYGRFVGVMGFDFNGTGETDQAKERLMLTTQNNIAMKLIAGSRLSLEASDGYIYMDSLVRLDHGFATARAVGYGTEAERKLITPEAGQLFFQID